MTYGSISRDEVIRLVEEKDAQVIEVLPSAEFNQEHISGAVNIPLKELTAERAESLDRSRPVITYCNDFL